MAIEDDIAELQQQIDALSDQISSINDSITSINHQLSALVSADNVPSEPGIISDISIDDSGTIISASSSGSAGSSLSFSRDDHIHPGDITRAPVDSPVFLGIPMSSYVPDLDSDDADSLVIATTMFVKQLCTKLINDSKNNTTVTIPPSSGEAQAPLQPGGNSEDLNIGGGGIHGIGSTSPGEGGDGGYLVTPRPEDGEDGGDGTDGEAGSIMVYAIPSGAELNWDIATYVHE
jgi:hypothetical protein